MPSVWIASIFLIFTSHKLDWYEWIYPTHFWFINAILCFFFIYWIAHKWIDKYPIKTVLITVSIHIIWYITQVNYAELSLDSTGIKVWFYNFIIFLLGNQIGKQSEKFKNKSSSIYLPVICIILFFGYKTLCKSYPQLCFWQFIIIPIIIFFFTFFTYRAVNILAQIKVSNYTQQILSQISNMTLDIYVVQIAVIQIINKHNLLFPLNIIVMLISISIASYLCYLISNKIAKFITNHIMIKFSFQRR